jgi:N-acetylglucosamine-6-phosphate deacetylase
MTLAPELPGNRESIAPLLVGAGTLPAWGHTDATAEVARAALHESAGLLTASPQARSDRPLVTHLFNGMRPWNHRDPGPIGEFLAAARAGRAVVEVIGDGVHLAPSTIRTIATLVGPDGVALVTDAMAATGMADGTYELGGRAVVVRSGVARLQAGGALAGGTAHLLDVVRTTVDAGVPLADAVHMATAVPARVLGLSDRGRLVPGLRADVLVCDPSLRPLQVLRGGAPVRNASAAHPFGSVSATMG